MLAAGYLYKDHPVYESWNAYRDSVDLEASEALPYVMDRLNHDIADADILFIKETMADIRCGRYIVNTLRAAASEVKTDLIVIIRRPIHVYLFEIDARKSHRGGPDIEISHSPFTDGR